MRGTVQEQRSRSKKESAIGASAEEPVSSRDENEGRAASSRPLLFMLMLRLSVGSAGLVAL